MLRLGPGLIHGTGDQSCRCGARDEGEGHGVPGQGQRAEEVREHFSIPFLGPGRWSLPTRTGGAPGHVSPDRPTPPVYRTLDMERRVLEGDAPLTLRGGGEGLAV